MATMNFSTTNYAFRQLIGNGYYNVPLFQRDYSWTEEEWDDLWGDIIDTCVENNEPMHYMGYLVLQSTDNKNFTIIDGQQRITTLSILVLAVLKNLQLLQEKGIDADDNKKREEKIRTDYIGDLDTVTLISKSKLKLNKHNDDFYQNYIVPLRQMPKGGLTSSEKLLKQSLEWFIDKIHNQISSTNGAKLAEFLDSVADKLFFTTITVTDELNAFKVFETLNARGVRLSSTDLLKNYLFQVVSSDIPKPHETEISRIEKSWETMVSKLRSESFPDFLRTYWNSENKLVRKSELFKVIKKQITSKQKVFELIRNLEDNLNIYIALKEPQNEFWQNPEQKRYVEELKMFCIKQPFGLLMSAYKKLNDSDFTKLLKACVVISFRYNIICGLNPNEQEKVYNKLAYELSQGSLTTINEIIDKLKAIYPEDASFFAAFSEKEINTNGGRNNKIVKYILFNLEKQLSNNDFNNDSDKYSIEHILPENPDESWTNYEESRDERFIYRLGNLTLLNKMENRDIANKNYESKKTVYENSQFVLTKEIAQDYDFWDIDKIANRQKQLAKLAKGIWKL